MDIDIIDYKGRVLNWRLRPRAPNAAMRLVLPHAGAHMRPFVLCPVADVAPRWRHPVLRESATTLLRGLKPSAGGQVLKKREESTAGLASSVKIDYSMQSYNQ
jgi:2-amino-4-hydroxy-6-hydroxymethyldihydropteridine diphosphokinase